jgi:hypothetical protein
MVYPSTIAEVRNCSTRLDSRLGTLLSLGGRHCLPEERSLAALGLSPAGPRSAHACKTAQDVKEPDDLVPLLAQAKRQLASPGARDTTPTCRLTPHIDFYCNYLLDCGICECSQHQADHNGECGLTLLSGRAATCTHFGVHWIQTSFRSMSSDNQNGVSSVSQRSPALVPTPVTLAIS